MRPLPSYKWAPGERWWKALDPIGVLSLVGECPRTGTHSFEGRQLMRLILASIYLPVTALFNGTAVGWASRHFIIPIVLALVPIASFVVWEWRRDGVNVRPRDDRPLGPAFS